MMKEYHVLRILFVAVMSTSSSARIENCPPLPQVHCLSMHLYTVIQENKPSLLPFLPLLQCKDMHHTKSLNRTLKLRGKLI